MARLRGSIVAIRLQLYALVYNLGNFMWTLESSKEVQHWSLTMLRERLVKMGAVLPLRAGARAPGQPRKTLPRIPPAPQAEHARHRAQLACDRTRRAILRRQQDNPRPQNVPLRRRRRAKPYLEHRAIPRPQPDHNSILNHPYVEFKSINRESRY